ncbi:hypothetical protein C3941_07815 [Kaistia algarum]|uniref:hypothetical protein n=1 Tax=Kaistia algarum TaxID=2083279 RepID=UPI000CE76329|nr:hypothetical protein [Kaistia algarum]MCX5511962.1 hypothetical protein [Kaistia algarum]PPE80094.1 hypothetical protein C3941_07815 [Kaistia algarum]
MNDRIRDWIATIAAEAERRDGWLEFEAAGGATLLVGGDVECGDESVAFDDDSGFRSEVAYAAIRAIRTGRQGEPGAGRRRAAPDFRARIAA